MITAIRCFASMMKGITILMLILLFVSAEGQQPFKPGYITDLSGNSIECLIRYRKWANNPEQIFYRLKNDSVVRGDAESIKEFGIKGECRYIRVKVTIDKSPSDVRALSASPTPEWSEETVFLQVLVSGNATLYSYKKGALRRYFFSGTDSIPVQLVSREYYLNQSRDSVKKDDFFRQQLWKEVKCAGTPIETLENLRYQKKELVRYFRAYNRCSGFEKEDFVRPFEDADLHIAFVAGFSLATIKEKSSINPWQNGTFSQTGNFQFAAEAEWTIPRTGKQLRVVFAPGFTSCRATNNSRGINRSIQNDEINFPLGLRYCILLNRKALLHLDGLIIPGYVFDFHSRFYIQENFSVPPVSRAGLVFGAGIKYHRFGLEARYQCPTRIAEYSDKWSATMSRQSVSVKYYFW